MHNFKTVITSFLLLSSLFFMMNGHASTVVQPADMVPVIIDTDMGFDDWMAILYLAKNPKVNIIAVSIDCYGETYCTNNRPARNAARLLKLAGKNNTLVYMGAPQAKHYWPTFPAKSRQASWKMQLPGFQKLAYNASNIHTRGGIAALVRLLVRAGQQKRPVKIISIGSAMNLSQAWQLAKRQHEQHAFSAGIEMIYKGGGAFGQVLRTPIKKSSLQLTNYNIDGNVNFPGFYLSNNTQAAWNIYVAAKPMQDLIASGLPITFVPTNLSSQVSINKASYLRLMKVAKHSKVAAFVIADIKNIVDGYGGWANNNLDYWDPSVAVAAINPGLITQKFQHVPVCVNIHKRKVTTISGYDQTGMSFYAFTPNTLPYYFSAILVNRPYSKNSPQKRYSRKACDYLKEASNPVTVDWKMSVDAFYQEFINQLA